MLGGEAEAEATVTEMIGPCSHRRVGKSRTVVGAEMYLSSNSVSREPRLSITNRNTLLLSSDTSLTNSKKMPAE